MTTQRIAVVCFRDGGDQGYEYLLPASAPEKVTHVVVTTRGNSSMKVAPVQAVKDLLDKEYTGELIPVIAAFNLDEYEAQKQRQKRKANLEKLIHAKLDELGFLERVKALGLDKDPTISSLVEEYKNL